MSETYGAHPRPAGGFELAAWLFMRISGIVLLFLALGIIYLPLRSVIFRSRITGWGAWAMIGSLLGNLVDGWVAGFGDATGWTMLVSSLWTGVAAMALGWLLRGLPAALQPVGKGGA